MARTLTKFALTLVALGAVGGVSYAGWRAYSTDLAAVATPAAATVEVRRGPFQSDIYSIGGLRAARSSLIGAPFEGKVIKLVPEGTRVEPGDPVAWFETTDYETSLEEQLAQLDLDNKDLEAARQALELEREQNAYSLQSEETKVEIARQRYLDAQRKYDSEVSLHERQIVPKNRVDEARLALLQAELNLQNAQINLAKVRENLDSNLRIREREIEKAELRVAATQREIDENRERIDSAIVTAQAPGDVSYLRIWKSGSAGKIAEGDTVWRMTNIMEIPDPAVMMAIIPVNEIDIARIQPGQHAEVQLEALPGRAFTGVVDGKSVVPITDPTQQGWGGSGGEGGGPREFEVRIRLDESSPDFRQGMTAAARVIVAELDDALQAPLEVLDVEQGATGVWRQTALGSEFVPVTVLMTNDNHAALMGDLAEGDRLYLGRPDGEKPTLPPLATAVPMESAQRDAAPGSPGEGRQRPAAFAPGSPG